jgi:hypothetical protein
MATKKHTTTKSLKAKTARKPAIANETVTINAQDFHNCHARVDEIYDMLADLVERNGKCVMSAEPEKPRIPGVDDACAKLHGMVGLLSDLCDAHEAIDDPVSGTIFTLWHLTEYIEAELQAAINARQW